ncbi:MAG: acyltransferase [Methylococcales bacterium]|nr:acyltransferase [Methylococcales bacterium]
MRAVSALAQRRMNEALSGKINQLRAIAALWVFCFHYDHFIAHTYFAPMASLNPIKVLIYNGYMGVSIFFCLSGFLFAQVYDAKDSLNPWAFYMKRLLRILPSVFIMMVVFFSVLNPSGYTLSSLLALVFLMDIKNYPQAIGHLWSINRELQCYALFPLLWLLNRHFGSRLLMGLGVLSFVTLIIWAIQTQPSLPYFYGSFRLRFCEFIVGMLASVGYRPMVTRRFSVQFFLVACVLLLTVQHAFIWQAPLDYSLFSSIGLCINSGLCVLFIRLYLQQAKVFPLILTKALERIGIVSYSFYLYHFLVIGFFSTHPLYLSTQPMANFAVLLAVSLSLAFIGYRLIEKPLLGLKNRAARV